MRDGLSDSAFGTAIASRTLDEFGHTEFATLSGDWNPMHVDAVAARRTQAGARVIHGVHTLLWALEASLAEGYLEKPLMRLRTKFLRWVYLENPTTLILIAHSDAGATLLVEVDSLPVLTVDVQFGSLEVDAGPGTAPDAPLRSPLELSFAELHGRSGNVFTASESEVKKLFPLLARHIGARAVGEIAACSYVVGMEAPGLHSMFSKLDVTLFNQLRPTSEQAALRYRVTYTDERFSKVRVAVTGAKIHGTIEAFMRDRPMLQDSMETIAAKVEPGEFEGMRGLVLGGSRGLGEVTARLIAAGGGSVTITYALGKEDALALAEEIQRWGGQAQTVRYDVLEPASRQVTELPELPTHLFYFATGTVFKPKFGLLSSIEFAKFIQFYVQGFYDLCEGLIKARMARFEEGTLEVFYPSTVFVEKRPKGMTEYAMVKAAGEQLCADMNLHMPGVHVVMARLPKLATDQTAGVLPDRHVNSAEVLLPILRGMQA